MTSALPYDPTGHPCVVCSAPISSPIAVADPYVGDEVYGHDRCIEARVAGDAEAEQRLREEACAAGYHLFPGRWQRDPADPHGDASYWDCAKGCGHRQAHPGYGVGAAIAALGATQ